MANQLYLLLLLPAVLSSTYKGDLKQFLLNNRFAYRWLRQRFSIQISPQPVFLSELGRSRKVAWFVVKFLLPIKNARIFPMDMA
jgi:hypothetical protein